MGQASTLYKISTSELEKLEEIFPNFKPFQISEESITIEKTVDAIILILSENQPKETQNIIEEIFAPETSIGKANWENEIFPVFYLSVEKVKQINDLLKTISIQKTVQSFDFNILKQKDIYPYWNWNQSEKSYLVQDLNMIKSFFENCSLDESIILVYTG